MWDMMTLYDTHKRKAEEREAYLAHKQQQKDLKEFYDTQMNFKKKVRRYEQDCKDKELVEIRKHHEDLGRHEANL